MRKRIVGNLLQMSLPEQTRINIRKKKTLTEQEKDFLYKEVKKLINSGGNYCTKKEFVIDKVQAGTKNNTFELFITQTGYLIFYKENNNTNKGQFMVYELI